MKHIKLFESEQRFVSTAPHAIPYLSEEMLKQSTDIFLELLELLYYPFIDKGYDVSFVTAHGAKIVIKYQDYVDKTLNWHIFINGFPKRGYFINIRISIGKFDPILLSSVIKDGYDECIERLPDMWKHVGTDIKLFPKGTSYVEPKMVIDIELDGRNRN